MFVWSVHNGATYYIDVFGKRFQLELEQVKRDVAKWQTTPEPTVSPVMTPKPEAIMTSKQADEKPGQTRKPSIDKIPMLDSKTERATGVAGNQDTVRERKEYTA